MAETTRNVISVPVVTSYNFGSPVFKNYFYHPDFAFQQQALTWNTGSGLITTDCLNAQGNVAFGEVYALSTYIGDGRPDDDPLPSGTLASALVGVHVGCHVARTQYSNVGAVSAGASFKEYETALSVNNSNYGTVTCLGNTGSSVSAKVALTSTNMATPGDGYAQIFNSSISISAGASARNSASLVGWVKDGVKSSSGYFQYGTDSVVAVFGLKFTLVFNANFGDDPETDSKTYYYGCSSYYAQGNIPANSWTRACYRFTGWNTKADGSGTGVADEADAETLFTTLGLSAKGSKTLYAQWEYTAFNVTVSKSYSGGAAGAEQPNVGTLTLVRVSDETTVATEDETTHTLCYEGTAGVAYRLDCTMGDGKPDSLWTASGVSGENPHTFTPSSGSTLTKSFAFVKRTLCSLTLAYSPSGAGTAAVTDPSEYDDSSKYVAGRDIEITATPATGYELTTARGTSGAEYSDIQDNKFTYVNISTDETLTLYFEKVTYTAKAEKDSASASAISAVSVTGSATGSITYQVGDTVTLNATVADGYSFDGWYVDGVRVSQSATYAYSGTGTKTFVAKAKVSVTLGVAYTGKTAAQQESCVLRVNDASYAPGTAFEVILGQSFSYALTMGAVESGGSDLWKFNAWFRSADVSSRTNPLAYGLTGTITPTAATSLVAEVTAAVITNTITIVMKEDEGQTDISQNGVITTSIEPDAGGWDATQGRYVLTFYGTKSVKITSLATVPDTLYAFNKYEDGTTECTTPEYGILTSGNRTITAWYGSTGTRTTTLAYGTSGSETGNRTMGTFEIASTTDPDGEISSDRTSAVVARGHSITIVAKPKNGYRFRGWYASQSVGGDAFLAGTEETLVISTDRNLYAWFAKDATAVYEWEGSGDSKSFEWRSKLYKAARPFNPSCCRVDTEGYPLVELAVEMFSAPDTAATARTSLANVASQTARRLPVRRPERYMQVCIRNNKEVDAVFVGTSMTELAQ